MKTDREQIEDMGTSATLAFGRPTRIPPDTDTGV